MGENFYRRIFSVFESEILGIAGVEGNGQKEVVESIIGIQNIESGEISLMVKISIIKLQDKDWNQE